MRSIRFSLLVFFLVLLAGALGGVSLLTYNTTAQTLREKQVSAIEHIHLQHAARAEELRQDLDRALLRSAKSLVQRNSAASAIKSLHALSVVTSPLAAPGIVVAPLWLRDGVPQMLFKFHAMQPLDHAIEAPEHEDETLPVYAQTFFASGVPWQRTQSMQGHNFTLDRSFRDRSEFFEERFDDVEMQGMNLRRVSLKVPVIRTLPMAPWPFQRFGGKGKGPAPNPVKAPPMPAAPPPPMAKGPPRFSFFETYYFVLFAVDTAPIDASVAALQRERDERISQVESDTALALRELRGRLLAISALTFVGILVGGFVLIRIGLAPLQRLSDAVSQVTERDFRLKLDTTKLPVELRPIADRLTQTLDQLHQAFTREKQAAQDISHELRTPLAALTTTLEVALKKSRSPADYRELLEECRLSARQMSHLVERLLELAKLDAGVVRLKLSNFDLVELAQECASIVRPLAQARDIALAVHAPSAVLLEADADKLHEIISNLLSNAVEYNRDQGRIDLTVDASGDRISLSVQDTGIGIVPEARERIFERFYRTDPSRHADTPHCGLGLAIVQSYVELMHGTITVDSDAAGTTFRVELPIRPIKVEREQFQLAGGPAQ
jgi:heavy metal sensor kinase